LHIVASFGVANSIVEKPIDVQHGIIFFVSSSFTPFLPPFISFIPVAYSLLSD
jgi:hypothetical protein